MAKLIILATFLVAVSTLAAETSTLRITTTTIIQEVDLESSAGSCKEQLKRQKLEHCQKYLFEGLGGPYGYFPTNSITDQQEKHLRPCCLELLDFDQECRCQAINKVLRQEQEKVGGSWEVDPLREIARKAFNIPDRCYIQPRLCQIFQEMHV